MAAILIVDDEPDILEILRFFSEAKFTGEILEAGSGNAAIETLKSRTDIVGVICDYNMAKGNGGTVFEYIQKNSPKVLFCLCSAKHHSECPEFKAKGPDAQILKPDFEPAIDNFLKQVSPIPSTEPMASKQPQYAPINAKTFLRYKTLHADLFIKLAEDKFVKIFNHGAVLSNEDVDHFVKKGARHFYINTSESAEFSRELCREVIALAKMDTVKPEIHFQMATNVINLTQGIARELGVTKEVEELITAALEVTSKIVTLNSNLLSLLSSFEKDPEGYLASHSIAIGSIGCMLAAMMSWESRATTQKLIMAAILHDVTLDPVNSTRISGLDKREMGPEGLRNAKERSFYFNHPVQAAALAAQIPNLPPDVDRIIVQHHERPDGSGFPNALTSTQIMPLSAIFIIAQDVFEFFQSSKTPPTLSMFLGTVQTEWMVGDFKKIYLAIKKNTETSTAA